MLPYHKLRDFAVMADREQLRKCEELLGELPEKPPARVHNPMWAFLKGIEGFDTMRASECLVKLLDEHYDTIEVLKLASKQDLVEDAGILPGDALRIVAAAKDYVAPQQADQSAGFGVSEPPPQSDARERGVLGAADHLQSVEHHPHAYRPPALRASTPGETAIINPVLKSQARPHAYISPVIQEQKTVKIVQLYADPSAKVVNQSAVPTQEAAKETKLVKQAAPKHIKDVTSPVKDSKVPEQIYSIPIGITYPHTCGMCNIQCVSEINSRMHYNGRTHRAKFAEVLASVKEAATEMKKPAETQKEEKQPTQSVPLHTCGVCNVKCTSEDNLRSHFNGRKHIQNMEAATDSNDNSPTKFLHCSICDINSGCKRNLVAHFNGKKHAQNMKVESESGDSYYDSASEC